MARLRLTLTIGLTLALLSVLFVLCLAVVDNAMDFLGEDPPALVRVFLAFCVGYTLAALRRHAARRARRTTAFLRGLCLHRLRWLRRASALVWLLVLCSATANFDVWSVFVYLWAGSGLLNVWRTREHGLTWITWRRARRLRRQPWQGYTPLACGMCRGTGVLPSRRWPDVAYPCTACRPRRYLSTVAAGRMAAPRPRSAG